MRRNVSGPSNEPGPSREQEGSSKIAPTLSQQIRFLRTRRTCIRQTIQALEKVQLLRAKKLTVLPLARR